MLLSLGLGRKILLLFLQFRYNKNVIERGINHNMSGLIWKANMLLVSLLRHDHHEKQFMIWKTLNYARCQKVSETQFASDPSTRPIFPSQSDRLDLKE